MVVVVFKDTTFEEESLFAFLERLEDEALVVGEEEEALRLARASEEVVDGLVVVDGGERLEQEVGSHAAPAADVAEDARRELSDRQRVSLGAHVVDAVLFILTNELLNVNFMDSNVINSLLS